MSVSILNDMTRKFVHSAFRIFESVPKVFDPNNSINEEYRQFIVQQSEQFRECLSILNNDINCIAETLDSMERSGIVLDKEYDLICNLEQTWNICEVFLLNPTKHISVEMSRWLKTAIQNFAVELAMEQMKSVEQPELLKSASIDAASFNYWDVVYKMIAQGNTLLACEALSLHSEINQLLNNPNANIKHHGVDRSQCQSLFEVLLSHPYIPLINGELSPQDEMQLLAQQSQLLSKFNDWQSKVKKLRSSNNALLMRIPQLDTILRILLGEMDTLAQVTEGDWMSMTLSMLLFVYPPPLTRANLSQVVEEVITYQHHERNESEALYFQMLRDIMAGNVGPVLKSLYEQGQRYLASSLQDSSSNSSMTVVDSFSGEEKSDSNSSTVHSIGSDISTISLLSVAHLSLLLVHGADKTDLLSPLNKGNNTEIETEEASFLETLFLEVSSKLNEMEFTSEIILGYLAICPTQGRHYARTLLTRRKLHSDQDALIFAASLKTINWDEESNQILQTRAQYWLQNAHPIYTGSAYVKSLTRPFSDNLSDIFHQSEEDVEQSYYISKVVYFLKHANDIAYIDSIIDRSLYRCMSAVALCKPLFSSLCILPMAPVPHNDALFMYTPEVEKKKGEKVYTQEEGQQLVAHLDSVLTEAEHILETLHNTHTNSFLKYTDLSDTEKQTHAQWIELLRSYVSAIRIGVNSNVNEDVSELFRAATLINGLVTAEVQFVPYRYYLHLLELSVWFSLAIANIKNTNNSESTQQRVNNDDDDACMQTEENGCTFKNDANSIVSSSSSSSYVNSKATAYALMNAFTRITSCHSFDRLLSGCGGSDRDVQSLRLALLGQVSNNVIQDNADIHANREYLRKINGGQIGAGGGMMKSDIYLRSRMPLAFRNTPTTVCDDFQDILNMPVKNNFAFYRAAGLPTDSVKAMRVRREIEVNEYLTASGGGGRGVGSKFLGGK